MHRNYSHLSRIFMVSLMAAGALTSLDARGQAEISGQASAAGVPVPSMARQCGAGADHERSHCGPRQGRGVHGLSWTRRAGGAGAVSGAGQPLNDEDIENLAHYLATL